jgi:tetratricopeptide (TPR) repeat protein
VVSDTDRTLLEPWERELSATKDPARRARLHYEIGRIAEMHLKDGRIAAIHYQEALTGAPEHVPALRGARRLHLQKKSYAQAVPLFDSEIRLTADPKRKAALLYAKGRVLEDGLGQRAEARAAYATAHDLDRGDASILKALEQHDSEGGKPDDLLRVLERSANAVATDVRHRAALVVQRARLVEHQKKDIEGAIDLYENALTLDPTSQPALDALKRLHHGRKRWRDLIRVLSHEGEQSEDPAVRAMAHYRVGRLQAERLGNRDEALRAMERARVEAPTEPLVLEELTRLFEAQEDYSALTQVLEARARLLETEASGKPPGESEAYARATLLHRLGQLREEKLGDAPGAIAAWQAAHALLPLHVPTLQALGRAYTNAEAWEPLVRMHLTEAELASEPKRRATAYARVAELVETRLSRPEQAIEHHARALTIAPGWPVSFKALVRLFSERSRFRELAELYARAVEEAGSTGPGGDEVAVTHLMKLGAVYEDALSDPAQAAFSYRKVLERQPTHITAIHALQRATERAKRWPEHVEALEREVALSKDPQQVLGLLHRAGEVLDEELSDAAGAMTRLKKALTIDPKYVPAMSSLGRLYHRAGRWEDLIELYRREAELAPSPRDAAALFVKMGEIAEERVGKDDEAIAHYRRALELDVGSVDALSSLARKLREGERWKDLAAVLEVELQAESDRHKRARIATRAAEVYEERLAQPERAVSLYELAREAEPTYRPALDALGRLRSEQSSFRKLADELEREAALVEDESSQVAALSRAAEVWGDLLNEPRRAAAAWEKVLERDPGHTLGLLSLESLHRRLGNHQELAKILATEARTLTDPGARIAALRELARVDETRLGGKSGEARAAHLAILSLSPDDIGTLGALERAALETSDAVLLAQVDERLADKAGDPQVEASYRVRLGEALESQDPARALESFRMALKADPESLAAARGLLRSAERAGDARALAEAARREAQILEDRPQASRLYARAGLVTFEDLGDPQQAASDYERALELDPDAAEPASRLLDLLLASDQAGRAVDRLSAAASSAKNEVRALDLWVEVARLQADAQNNIPAAIASLSRVAKSSAAHVPTLRRLADLYQRAEAWTEAAQTLGKVVQLAPDRDALKDAHLELSGIYERTDERPRMRVSIQAVLALEPGNRVALSRLAALEVKEGNLDKAAEAQKKRIEASLEGDDRAEAYVALAQIEDKRGQPSRAWEALAEAVTVQGPSSDAAKRLRKALADAPDTEAAAGWARYATALAEHVRRAPALIEVRLALAQVLGDQLGRNAEAAQVLRDAVKAFPDEIELRRHLARRLARAGQTPEAIDVLRRLADARPERPEGFRDLRLLLGPAAELSQLAAAPLMLIGPDPAEAEAYRARRSSPASGRPGSFGLDLVAPLAGIEPSAPVLGALAALPEAITKMWPADLEDLGVNAREKLTTRSGHPLRLLSDRVAAMFGVADHELYVHRMRGRGVVIELSEPPAIVVPQTALELGEAAQVFALARAHAHVASRTAIVEKLQPRELEVLIAAAMRPFAPSFGAGLTSEDVLEDQQKRIHRALSRRARKALEELAPRYVAAPPADFAQLVRGIQYGVARAALVVADDLVQSVEFLHRSERDYAADVPTLLKTAPLVQDLVRFWTSDVASAVRRRLNAIG